MKLAKRSSRYDEVWELIKKEGPVSLSFINKEIGVNWATLEWIMRDLEEKGRVFPVQTNRGKFYAIKGWTP